MNKTASLVVARLTAARKDGSTLLVEVSTDATFSEFYKFYIQQGRKRSTKAQIRVTNRNEGLRPWHKTYRMEPGLDAVALQLGSMPHLFSQIKVRILKKRAYRKLIEAAPDVLGMTKAPHLAVDQFNRMPTPRIPVRIPVGWLTIQDRMNILTGK